MFANTSSINEMKNVLMNYGVENSDDCKPVMLHKIERAELLKKSILLPSVGSNLAATA